MSCVPWRVIPVVFLLWSLIACGSGPSGPTVSGEPAPPSPEPTAAPEPTPMPEPEPEGVQSVVTHGFEDIVLGPGEELASDCISWTLNNEKPLYVNQVTLANGGAYHHSNWFVVPEHSYPGPDGRWRCGDRQFSEDLAAVIGTVLFAQSTQSIVEEQAFAPGVVVKIPPRHKIVGAIHLLNPALREHETFLRMSLALIHPREVTTILHAIRLNYGAIDIPPRSEARVTADCDLTKTFDAIIQQPMDVKMHYVLPHYHYLGNYFSLEIAGGPRDGEVLHSLDTFNAEPNGKRLDPPIDLGASGAYGLRMSCGYSNPRDESVGWGIGDQEMCVTLVLADSPMLLSGNVGVTTDFEQGEDGIFRLSGPCDGIGAPINPAQTLPSDEEVESPLYVPPVLPGDERLPIAPPCVDTPPALSEPPETLSSIEDGIFVGSCTFAACHDNQAPAAGLDLSQNVHENLMGHAVQARTALPLVASGDPEGSWLYQLLSRCEPMDDEGNVVAHMPRNSPQLLPPELVAKVREWIRRGARDD